MWKRFLRFLSGSRAKMDGDEFPSPRGTVALVGHWTGRMEERMLALREQGYEVEFVELGKEADTGLFDDRLAKAAARLLALRPEFVLTNSWRDYVPLSMLMYRISTVSPVIDFEAAREHVG